MHGVGGISLSEVKGRGKIPHEAVPHIIQALEHMSTIVPDSKVTPVIDDLFKLPPTRGYYK